MNAPPGKISGYLSGVINGIIDFIAANKIRSSATIKATVTPRGTTLEVPQLMSDASFKPFQISVSGDDIRVEQGRWTRNGVDWEERSALELTVDANKTYKTITGTWTPSTWYYVWVYLYEGYNSADPTLYPISIDVAAGDALPDDDDEIAGNRYVVLGRVYCDADGYFNQPDQWQFGDIDDVSYVPDADSPYDDSAAGAYRTIGAYRYYSTQFVSARTGTKWQRNIQIYEWDDPTTIPVDTSDLMMVQDVSDDNRHLRYFTLQTLKTYIEENFSSGGSTVIGDWLNDNEYIIHHQLNSTTGIGISDFSDGGGHANDDHDYRYPEPDSPASGTDANAGVFSLTNSTAAGSGVGALKLTAGGMYAAKGCWITDVAGNIVSLCDGSIAATILGNVDVTGIIDISSGGDYYHNGNQGQTVSNWFGGGILTGTVVEKSFGDIDPSDKVLVRV